MKLKSKKGNINQDINSIKELLTNILNLFMYKYHYNLKGTLSLWLSLLRYI